MLRLAADEGGGEGDRTTEAITAASAGPLLGEQTKAKSLEIYVHSPAKEVAGEPVEARGEATKVFELGMHTPCRTCRCDQIDDGTRGIISAIGNP